MTLPKTPEIAMPKRPDVELGTCVRCGSTGPVDTTCKNPNCKRDGEMRADTERSAWVLGLIESRDRLERQIAQIAEAIPPRRALNSAVTSARSEAAGRDGREAPEGDFAIDAFEPLRKILESSTRHCIHCGKLKSEHGVEESFNHEPWAAIPRALRCVRPTPDGEPPERARSATPERVEK